MKVDKKSSSSEIFPSEFGSIICINFLQDSDWFWLRALRPNDPEFDSPTRLVLRDSLYQNYKMRRKEEKYNPLSGRLAVSFILKSNYYAI
ncbi:hypothetical protein SK128_023312 [Halocaridina rubra]|uniref:Uncharacterized protein n=1 Tax=Halocaridina rubra TaxID=373956 RepID=A0AAN8XPQ0_HALRR